MIKEIGVMPSGVFCVEDYNSQVKSWYLGDRLLFKLSALDIYQAIDIVVDWNDIDRMTLQHDVEAV